MKFKSEVLTQASGSIGGTTYAHNRGGLYRRARSIPVNPNTAAQQAARNNVTALVAAWAGVLTQLQRDQWENYAANNPVTDKLGDPLVLTGQQMYVRCNSVRLRGGATRVDDGPVVSGLVEVTTPTIEAGDGDLHISVTFDNSDAWANEDDAGLVVQQSRQFSPARNFFKGPYRYASTIDGDSVTPPTSPATSTNPFNVTMTDTLKIFARIVAFRADGRISGAFNVSAIAE